MAPDLLPLASLGRRICICGPAGSGKSTLARALGHALGCEVVHLDRLYHLPHTHWQPRPEPEFDRLHAAAIAGQSWVMDGNYSRLLGPRLERATGIVDIRLGRVEALLRYLRRTLLEKDRAGRLEGGQDRLNFKMIRFILVEQPARMPETRGLLAGSGLPRVTVEGAARLKQLYRSWNLPSPPQGRAG